jgi:ABC-type sugar transport system ATPase subunit
LPHVCIAFLGRGEVVDTFLLETENLTKNYGATVAAKNVSMRLASGRVHGLVGENGAGKSTIIKIITGLVRPSSGNIKWQDIIVAFHSPRDARSLGIVAVHQELTTVDTLTIAQNIWLGHEDTNWAKVIAQKTLEMKSRALIESMGLELDPNMTVSRLSLSEKQLVEILKALSLKPKLLILDEATSALDENEVEMLYKTIKTLTASGCSVLFVSHRMKEIFQFCDFCSILKPIFDSLKN